MLWLRCLDATGRGSDVLLEFRDEAEDNPENWKRHVGGAGGGGGGDYEDHQHHDDDDNLDTRHGGKRGR